MDDDVRWLLYASALPTGIIFGYVMQRGGFCLTRALSNLALAGDATLVRGYLLALLVAMVGVHGLVALGLVDIGPRPFRWVANIAGGLLFGVGMIISGGCSGSTWYRVGEGAIGAWVILLGFAIGASTTSVGLLSPVRAALQAPTITVDGAAPTLPGLLHLSPWIVIALLAAGVGVWLLRARTEPEHGKWPWTVTGVAVGATIALGWWASGLAGRPSGITFASNTGHLLTYPLVGYPTQITWGMVMALGVPLGAFGAAKSAGEFRWKLPPGWTVVKLFGGGLLMGSAALLADGCNINQGLTNSATLSIGSLVTFASMGAGAYIALWALYLRPASAPTGRARP
jgi:uncharacterized membrane protein YedE/YeeE